ncbi:MAG: hypothetical protein IJI66_10525 [Erysipelotrichaceae bacterium]|nr:hypothetical protein [Erysipelotrichaceae bacterium]
MTSAKISKKQARELIDQWLDMPYLEKTKAWNGLLSVINEHKDVYEEAVLEKKAQKNKNQI